MPRKSKRDKIASPFAAEELDGRDAELAAELAATATTRNDYDLEAELAAAHHAEALARIAGYRCPHCTAEAVIRPARRMLATEEAAPELLVTAIHRPYCPRARFLAGRRRLCAHRAELVRRELLARAVHAAAVANPPAAHAAAVANPPAAHAA